MKKNIKVISIVLALILLLAACGTETKDVSEIKIGYFPRISHGPAMVGIEKGLFAEKMGDYKISTSTFPNGSLFMDALATEQIDIGYVGPGPVLNRYLQGGEVVAISNSSKGENVLIVRKDAGIHDIKDLGGKIVATPSTGCTHDLLLRKILQENNMATEENGGTVKRITQKPSTMIGLFQQNQIDAAIVSEPWASVMEAEGIVEVLRDSDELPWEGNLPATILVVRKDFLEENTEAVNEFLEAHEDAINFINNNKEESINIIGSKIKEITNQDIERNIINNSFNRVAFTTDLNKGVLQEFADLSGSLGFINGSTDISNMFDN
ncbi:aliphatic sulfonate ABC transporter substrate-binding protein [Sporosalibacterium faouarense]|uniref:aliphatic sulfonate ABC transporter substrate-binding protein n=1 Tax=Sporosalibacterium faouarense TaxID=516123 RepID=UPI00141D6A5A|nr:aliphatic sulfonate ABC transporter substrate-binding protein [Sporosalibacterium faouarense]MTI48537.1 aliphatic sulfonate ABC transporter substrate-binding protein [Bacillota bacterium]